MDIFRYSPSSRKMVALFVNIGKREKKKPLERSRCNETIVIKPLQRSRCKVSPFFLIFNFSPFVYREKSNNSSSLCTDTEYKENNSVYLSNKYNINFFLSLPGILPPSSHRSCKLGRYFDLW